MTDPSNALQSFQEEISHGRLRLQRGRLDPSLTVYFDEVGGLKRLAYARIEGGTVTALAIFVSGAPVEDVLCFDIGYAVPETHRNQGRAKGIVSAGISDLQDGLRRSGTKVFYVRAIAEAGNVPSQRVAEAVLSTTPEAIIETLSGLPAFGYVRKIEYTSKAP